MNWLKVAAVAVGALLAFLLIGSVIHLITAILGWVLIIALVGGTGYIVYKITSNRHGREVRDKHRGREIRDHHRDAGRAAPPPPPATGDVDDELARIRREMRDMGL